MLLNTIVEKLNKNKTYKIAFLGDSITSTEWVHPNWREIVEYVVKDHLDGILDDWKLPSWGLRFFNFGFDGATTKDLMEKLNNEVVAVKPDLVILMATSNDIFFDISVEQHKANILQMLNQLKDLEIDVVYATDICSGNPDYDKKYLPYLSAALEIFKEPPELCLNINMFQELGKFDYQKFFTFISDGNENAGIKPGEIDFIHPNVLGNAYIAKILLNKVFEIEFDPELYLKDVSSGKMLPDF